MTAGWEVPYRDWPKAPMNGQVVGPLSTGINDLRWDNPATLGANGQFTLSGVNIYRSDVGERGPYFRINTYPIGGNFYRDRTQNVLISNENVDWNSSWMSKGDGPNDRDWVFRTKNPIIDRNEDKCVWAGSPSDVCVVIDGQQVIVNSVFGRTGEVRLINRDYFDPLTETLIPPVLPTENSTVTVSYYMNKNYVETGLEKKVWYRITSVGFYSDNPSAGMVETPLDYCQPLTHYKVESMDYIWREAVRRNNWILEQGGERVYLFIRKTAGIPCQCALNDRTLEYNQMPRNQCRNCYGTGFVGGYEGPYNAILVPDEADRRVGQTERGRHLEFSYEVWMGPTPLLTMRDFVVKQTNERFSIGAVRRPNNRGNILQQHFTIAYLDESDIRYKVPLDGLSELPFPQNRITVDPRETLLVYPIAEQGPAIEANPDEHSPEVYPSNADYKSHPMISEKDNIDDSRERRGRTITYDNQNYLWWLTPFAFWLWQFIEIFSQGTYL